MARYASKKEKLKEVPLYKDSDFINEGIKIHIGAEPKQRLMTVLKSDTDVSCLTPFSSTFLCKVSSVSD